MDKGPWLDCWRSVAQPMFDESIKHQPVAAREVKGTWSVWRFELRPPIAPPIAETLFFAVHVAMVHIIDDVGSMHARTAL